MAVQVLVNEMVWAAGQVMVGTDVSVLFTVKEQLFVLPLPSLAVRVTIELPTPVNTVPDAGDWVTTGVPQLSALLPMV